ncbi:GrlR family regulatory protein [Maricaulaceae bacterium MS644]
MTPGLYITEFRTPLDDASGVIVVDGDRVRGGDSAMHYVGEITGRSDALKVRLRVRKHDMSKESVFGEVDDFTLTLTGRRKGEHYVFEGRADRAPSLGFQAVLTRVPE